MQASCLPIDWNIDLWSVCPAELDSAESQHAKAYWPHRLKAYVPLQKIGRRDARRPDSQEGCATMRLGRIDGV